MSTEKKQFITEEVVETPIVEEVITEEEIPVVQNEAPTIEEAPALEETTAFGTVNAKLLNLRKTPSLQADVLAKLPIQTEVEIDKTNTNNKWYKVKTKYGVVGFVVKEFITLK